MIHVYGKQNQIKIVNSIPHDTFRVRLYYTKSIVFVYNNITYSVLAYAMHKQITYDDENLKNYFCFFFFFFSF